MKNSLFRIVFGQYAGDKASDMLKNEANAKY